MELLYRGFDGFDVSFQAQIAPALCHSLENAKAQAQKERRPIVLDWNGVFLEVAESGARGGYAYRASTGQFGATWFFKRPSAHDRWGIRLSCNSFFLAANGLGNARSEIYRLLELLQIQVSDGCESIGRADYCLDFLIPSFALSPTNFVMHSNARRADHIENPAMQVNGRSGRVTSVTVGKMPGRQVIVYDKRAEIIAKRKLAWWEIWDASRKRAGHDPLQRERMDGSVWRVEVRAGKRT